jgi:hypothetical protein
MASPIKRSKGISKETARIIAEAQNSGHIKCLNCPGVRYRSCVAPETLTNGLLPCEQKAMDEEMAKEAGRVCSQCDNALSYPHLAFDERFGEFWCEDCIRELAAKHGIF